MPFLEYKSSDSTTISHPIVRRLTTLGSSTESHIILSGNKVASSHAILSHEPGKYRLESTARANTFLVNGKKSRTHDLKHGDLIAIGDQELIFSVLDSPSRSEAQSQETKELHVDAMQRLQRFSQLLLEPYDLNGLLDELIDHVVALTRASKGFLVLASGDDYQITVARNLERQPVDDPAQLLSDDIIREVITSRKPQIISDALKDQRFQNSMSVINLRLSSVMCVPLIVRGELLGLIYVGNDAIVNLFNQIQLDTLSVFASQAALFIKTAVVMNELRSESAGLAQMLDRVRFGSIIGACPQMVEIYKRVEKVAATDITVLIHGETGTGKELIAREVHNRSPRSKGPFIIVNCGAIPENLIESELFGHLKGSFTGAINQQIGKFEAANGGTIFLDEIGELPLPLQVKLLRVLQERQIQKVGATGSTPIDIRIVAATNRDLHQEVKEGRFREDLYFRLNVIALELPPLRERGDDLLTIARYLIGRFSPEFGKTFDPASCLDVSAIRAILRYPWPGNIRQLENHVKKAMVLADGPYIRATDLDLELPEGSQTEDTILPLSEARDLWQRQYINQVLALNNGNRTKAARALGVDPRTIFRHLEKEEKSRRGEEV